MKRAIFLLSILCGLIILYLYLKDSRDRELISRGNEIIQKIEAFRLTEGRLPNSLEELGIIQEDQLFYNKWDSVNYMVWYGTDLGESVTYYSDSKEWEEKERGFNVEKK